MPSFVEIGPPVPEKILEDSATRLYDLRSFEISRNSEKSENIIGLDSYILNSFSYLSPI